MGFFLGIDGGGTKTECVLADESGVVVARTIGDGANLRRTSATELRATLSECLEALRQQAGLARLECDAVCGGFAGAGVAEARLKAEEVLRKLLRPKLLAVVGDMEVALEAAVGAGPGVVLIAGTGSIAFGRNAAGKSARAGGEGPIFSPDGEMVGDIGSGIYIGSRAFQAVLIDPRAEERAPILTMLFLAESGAKSLQELEVTMGCGIGVEVAGLVPMVIRAAHKGDPTARKILEDSAAGLAKLAVGVLQELRMATDELTLATSGGVFEESDEIFAGVRSQILAAAPRARVELLRVSPAEGAVRMAQRRWLEQKTGR